MLEKPEISTAEMRESRNSNCGKVAVRVAGNSQNASYIEISNKKSNNKEDICADAHSFPPSSSSFECAKCKASKSPPKPKEPEPQKPERAPNVHTSDEEHAKLVAQYGEDFTIKCYDRLSTWKAQISQSKWRKNDYLAITRGWVARAEKEAQIKDKELIQREERLKNGNGAPKYETPVQSLKRRQFEEWKQHNPGGDNSVSFTD